MDRREHLLTIFAEECGETAQRASKSLRFGDSEIQPGQSLSNGERLNLELIDLLAMHDMLVDEGICPALPDGNALAHAKDRKCDKVEGFLRYSEECGMLDKANNGYPEKLLGESRSLPED
jgi:hypothetical protein